jgi:alpha-aminoadipate/glutamate carrier protein LysW
LAVDFTHPVYNTLDKDVRSPARRPNNLTEDVPVIRCPECSAEIDVDEDEVEEGEILSCPECEIEMEISQIHPVRLNVISEEGDDDDDDDEEEDDEEKEGENGDLIDEDEEEEEEEDEE